MLDLSFAFAAPAGGPGAKASMTMPARSLAATYAICGNPCAIAGAPRDIGRAVSGAFARAAGGEGCFNPRACGS